MSALPSETGSVDDAWVMQVEHLSESTQELHVLRHGTRLSYGEVTRSWCEDRAFVAFFDAALGTAAGEAVFWETPPVTLASIDQPFSCVLVDAPTLSGVAPEPGVFDAELQAAGPSGISRFPNLGGDALLVVPAARAEPAAYAHLAAFLQRAPPDQRHALWTQVGRAIEARIGQQPLWVSTSGLGVAWLHVRLDSVPKYYVHAPYRMAR